jgi:hypothetical protein
MSRTTANQWLERTARQRRWRVPSALPRSGRPSATSLGGTMAQRSEPRCRHHASKEPVGMNVHQRLMHSAAAGALARQQSGPSHISPVSLRFDGLWCSSQRLCGGERPKFGVAFARVSVGVFCRLPPNNRVNRTAQQRRCACWWVPSALRATAAAQPHRSASPSRRGYA